MILTGTYFFLRTLRHFLWRNNVLQFEKTTFFFPFQKIAFLWGLLSFLFSPEFDTSFFGTLENMVREFQVFKKYFLTDFPFVQVSDSSRGSLGSILSFVSGAKFHSSKIIVLITKNKAPVSLSLVIAPRERETGKKVNLWTD